MKPDATPRSQAARLEEIASHTALRGIAALMVVFYHYRQNLRPHWDVDAHTGVVATSYAFVDLFFILSGFIIAAVYSDRFAAADRPVLRSFLAARFARLYPLHLLTLVFMVALTLRDGRVAISEIGGDLIQNLLMIHAWGLSDRFVFNYPSWSISGEWAAYLLYPLLAALLARRGGAAGFILVIAAAYVALLAGEGGLNAEERLSLLRAVPGFMFGMLIHRWRAGAAALSDRALSVIQITALVWIFAVMHFRLVDGALIPAFAILTLSLWTDRGAVAAAMARGPLRRPLAALGLWSYTIYMLHVPARAAMELIWPKLPFALAPAADRWLFVCLCLAATIIGSAIIYRYFERPARDALRRRFANRPPPVLRRRDAP